MSDSLRPRELCPTRLLHPWDSPGKNTGVGCHFLLLIKVRAEQRNWKQKISREIQWTHKLVLWKDQQNQWNRLREQEERHKSPISEKMWPLLSILLILKRYYQILRNLCPKIWSARWNRPIPWNTQSTKIHTRRNKLLSRSIFLLYWLCQSLWLCGSQ